MKTRTLATALESGRVSSSKAQAWGLVSRMMVSRDGEGSEKTDTSVKVQGYGARTRVD